MDHEKIVIQSSRIILKPFTANDADGSYACITPTLTYCSEKPKYKSITYFIAKK